MVGPFRLATPSLPSPPLSQLAPFPQLPPPRPSLPPPDILSGADRLPGSEPRTRGVQRQGRERPGSRGMSHRATTIDFDLNEIPEEAVELQEVLSVESSNAPIDLGAADDEVIVLSSHGSSRVGNPAGAPPLPTILLDEDIEVQQEEAVTRLTLNSFNGHTITQAAPPKRTIVNCDLDCLDSEHEGKKARGEEEPKPKNEEKKEPTFSCTICWGPLVEETSTNCGHIFCQSCIKKAIKIHKRCPTCRKSINMKSIHRIYFPAAE